MEREGSVLKANICSLKPAFSSSQSQFDMNPFSAVISSNILASLKGRAESILFLNIVVIMSAQPSNFHTDNFGARREVLDGNGSELEFCSDHVMTNPHGAMWCAAKPNTHADRRARPCAHPPLHSILATQS